MKIIFYFEKLLLNQPTANTWKHSATGDTRNNLLLLLVLVHLNLIYFLYFIALFILIEI